MPPIFKFHSSSQGYLVSLQPLRKAASAPGYKGIPLPAFKLRQLSVALRLGNKDEGFAGPKTAEVQGDQS